MTFPRVTQDELLELSREDLQFMDNVSLVEGHFCIGLPPKNKELCMPNNRAMAEQLALNLRKKLLKNPSFREYYIAIMTDMITKGYALKVPDNDLR